MLMIISEGMFNFMSLCKHKYGIQEDLTDFLIKYSVFKVQAL